MAYGKYKPAGSTGKRSNYTRYQKPDASLKGSEWNPNTLPVPTPEVEAILNAVNLGKSVTVEAAAGSGKTTTAKQMFARTQVRNRGLVRYYAFNKSVQLEAERALPADVEVITFHAAGLRLLKQTGKRFTTDARKMSDLYTAMGERVKDLDQNLVEKLTRLARINLAISAADVADIAKVYNIPANASELDVAFTLMCDCDTSAKLGIIDFDDMLRMPVLWDLSDKRANVAFIDEAQDLSAASVELIKRTTAANAQFVIVGDPMQAIYGFAGASPTALNDLSLHANSHFLPLFTCRRCDTAIVQHANEIEGSTRTKARIGADTGTVETLETPKEFFSMVADSDLVLSRVRSSLIEIAFRFYREGREFQYMGDSPFKQLCNKLYPYVKNTASAIEFREGLAAYVDEHDTDLDALALDPDGDILACTLTFANALLADASVTSSRDMYDLADKLGSGKRGPKLSTVHKAKGLEADTVYVVDPYLMPHPRAETDNERLQESNLIYVARTRARHTLRYVNITDPE